MGPLEDPARDRGTKDGSTKNGRLYDGLRRISIRFQSKLMALVSNMMWLSTAARFASAGKSARRNSTRSSDTAPVSVEEEMPWKCQRLIVGTGRYGSLPVMAEVKREARRREIELLILPADQALETLVKKPKETNAILHVTC